MDDPKEKKEAEVEVNLDKAEHTLHESVAQSHPEWMEKGGECSSCVSIEHEMAADPTNIPEDLAE